MKPRKRKFSRQPKRRQPPGTSWEPMPDAESADQEQTGCRVGDPDPHADGRKESAA